MPRSTTVNSEYYKGLLERLRNDVQRKRPEKWKNGFVLHHGNTPRHMSLVIHQLWLIKNYHVSSFPILARLGTLRFLAIPES
jgi:hypothetical protein